MNVRKSDERPAYRVHECSRCLVGFRLNPRQVLDRAERAANILDTLDDGFFVRSFAQVRGDGDACG